MEHALSTHLFASHRLTTVWLDRIWDAGIPLVELFCARQHLDYRDRAQISELGHWFRDSKLKVHSLHSPMYTDEIWGRSGPHSVISITEPVKSQTHRSRSTKSSAPSKSRRLVPFRYLIQHLGVTGEEYDERKVDAAFTVLEELSLFARQRGVEVLLENTPNALSSAERLLTFLDATHLDLNVCLDVGHANMNEGVETAFRLLKDRIRSTHIHDNNGKERLAPVSALHLRRRGETSKGSKQRPGNDSTGAGPGPPAFDSRTVPAAAQPRIGDGESAGVFERPSTALRL